MPPDRKPPRDPKHPNRDRVEYVSQGLAWLEDQFEETEAEAPPERPPAVPAAPPADPRPAPAPMPPDSQTAELPRIPSRPKEAGGGAAGAGAAGAG
ncbi:MAG TPA: hypothetical protein VE776_09500, partial [Actinomycetota bacterium]|nr:hypothetical protein [Actinomycetota bacterium]